MQIAYEACNLGYHALAAYNNPIECFYFEGKTGPEITAGFVGVAAKGATFFAIRGNKTANSALNSAVIWIAKTRNSGTYQASRKTNNVGTGTLKTQPSPCSKQTHLPENPNNLYPGKIRNAEGTIKISPTKQIRIEQHNFKNGDIFNPRHHEIHYHFETQKNPDVSWKNGLVG